MTDSTSLEPGAAPRPVSPSRVREASGGDVAVIAAAIAKLLTELGGKQPAPAELEAEVEALLADPAVGVLLVAEAEGEIVGVLGASWQRAIHVPGRYALIQDLWVDPAWRSRKVGADLVAAMAERAREQGVARLEVGLPQESFAAIRATEAFYAANGFAPLGLRMRRLLP
jgi:GNAT superfamily N-acetyltransferase